MTDSSFFSINSVVLFTLQFRERLNRRLNVIFPSDANPTRRTPKVNPSDVGVVERIEMQPCGGVF